MNIRLYNISDNPNKVSKNAKKDEGTLFDNVRFKEKDALNVLNPTLILDMGTELSDCVKYNYVYIPKTTRFYYITNIKAEGGLIYIETRVDVLMSFKSDILNSEQYVTRSQSTINGKLVDSLLPIHSDHLFMIQPFGDSVYDENCNYCILETAGKGSVV